ncbi:hypothetical protein ACROYT_G040828 [Oculina patagonica]
MESVKKETEARIYDHVRGESATPGTEQTSLEKCMQGAEEKRNASAEHEKTCQCDTVVLRRMLFLVSVVAAAALLVAIATLILAVTVMKLQNDSSTKLSLCSCKENKNSALEPVSDMQQLHSLKSHYDGKPC